MTRAQTESVNLIDPPLLNRPVPLDRPVRIMLLVSSLEYGGAERQVVQLANNLDPRQFDVTVCSLSARNPLAPDLGRHGMALRVIEKRWRFDAGTIRRAARLMRALRIDIVHAYMFDAEMVARIAAKLAGVPIVVASERNACYRRPRLHTLCQKLTAPLHHATIANSNAGREFNIRTLGTPADRVHVVYNGVNIENFRPRADSPMRRAWGIGAGTPVVGMVASLKPQKNHMMFVRVARRVLRQMPDVRFVCVGEHLEAVEGLRGLIRGGGGAHGNTAPYRREVAEAMNASELRDRLILLGHCDDMPGFYNACDLTLLTSRHEGTPNVLLESMACGVPVIATNVADNAHVVPEGRVGHVVELDDDAAMAKVVMESLADPAARRRMGAAARDWARQEFSTAALAEKTAAVYRRLLWQRRHPVEVRDRRAGSGPVEAAPVQHQPEAAA